MRTNILRVKPVQLQNFEVKIVYAVKGQPVWKIASARVKPIQPTPVALLVIREDHEAQVARLSKENNIHRRCPVQVTTGLESCAELLFQS